MTETISLVQLLDRPADFDGKMVRVEGCITVGVHMGRWMALTLDASADSRAIQSDRGPVGAWETFGLNSSSRLHNPSLASNGEIAFRPGRSLVSES